MNCMKEKQINCFFSSNFKYKQSCSVFCVRSQMAHLSNCTPSANNKHDWFKLESE